MRELSPFSNISEPIEILGSFSQKARGIAISFQLHDPQNKVLDTLQPAQWSAKDLSRTDGLWQTTCFEAFFAVKGQKKYWELNVSPNQPKWNLYSFDDYREPQPPKASEDFQIKKVEITRESLRCQLSGSVQGDLEASLCVVIKTEGGTHYFSTRHAGPKPDFHLRESMTL